MNRTLIIALFLMVATSSMAKSQTLSITSPLNNALYHPGDTVVVTVDQPAGGYLTIGTDSHFLVSPQLLTSPPYSFFITLPADTSAGTYEISAITPATSPRDSIHAVATNIVVEPNAPLGGATLSVSPASLSFRYAGQSIPVEVYLKQNGSSSDISDSSQLSAMSANSAIAAVQGVYVTAGTSVGATTVTFTLNGLSVILPVKNSTSSIRGDLNGDGRVDIDDLNILDAALNTPANGPTDARDLNYDGKIDALDARILTTLCTYPRCATHP
jgi:hypothetical protein